MSSLEVLAAAMELERFFFAKGWRFCFIGGIANQRWGQPRFTSDVDATLFTGWGMEATFIDPILAQFPPRTANARQFALDRRVLLGRTKAGVQIDIMLGGLPYEERAIERATVWHAEPNLDLTTCSAEDLVIHKVFAGRERDWQDVRDVLIRQKGKFDLEIVREELPELLSVKDDLASLAKLDKLIAQFS